MFLGTIDDNVRRYLAGNRAAFAGRTVVVGCSGNFTSEKIILQSTAPAAVHSNDVSLYSLLLADAMLGTETPLAVLEPEYAWLAPYLFDKSPWHRVAAAMLLLRMLKHEKQRSAHAKRLWHHYCTRFDELVDASAQTLAARAVPITSYFNGDVFDHFLAHADTDAIFTAYLPFFKGDYEAQYRRLQQVIQWPAPTYALLDAKRKAEILAWMQAPGRDYLFLLNEPLPDVPCQMISHKQRNTWIYLYSNVVEKRGLFRRNYGDTGVRYQLASPAYRFRPDTRLQLVKIPSADIQYYKGLYLARNIDFTAAEQGFAVVADGHLPAGGVVGFIEMSRGKGNMNISFEGEVIAGLQTWYMLSDFPSEPKPHDKVSKLIVMVANTVEMRRLVEASALRRTVGIMTTARTAKPVSMKYRGPMTLIKRGVKDGEPFLNYYAKWKPVSVQEAYTQWWKKFGQPSPKSTN